MSSNWQGGDYEKFIAHVQKERPNLKKNIDKKISDIFLLVKQYDPLDFLAVIATRNCFVDPEAYTESSHKGRECFVEFALSLVLSQEREKGLPRATKDTTDKFLKLISEVMNNVLWYFGSEVAERKRSRIEEEIRFSMIGWHLYVRGDSYLEHHVEMIREIFQPHSNFFKQHHGFDSDAIISVLQRISDQPVVNLREHTEVMALMMEMHELFKKFVDAKGIGSFSSIEDMKSQYFALSEVQEKKAKLDEKSYVMDKSLFEVSPSADIPQKILDLISSKFGENAAFAKVHEFNAWPTNDSVINTRPLIKEDGKYYCFMPQMVFRQMSGILEQMILDKNNNYYQNTYLNRRSKYLEGKTLEYLGKLLPGARILGNLFYTVEEDEKSKRVETDGLILYDQNLFIIEAKARRLSASSRRGGLMRLKDELKDVVEEGFQQAERTKRYINETAL